MDTCIKALGTKDCFSPAFSEHGIMPQETLFFLGFSSASISATCSGFDSTTYSMSTQPLSKPAAQSLVHPEVSASPGSASAGGLGRPSQQLLVSVVKWAELIQPPRVSSGGSGDMLQPSFPAGSEGSLQLSSVLIGWSKDSLQQSGGPALSGPAWPRLACLPNQVQACTEGLHTHQCHCRPPAYWVFSLKPTPAPVMLWVSGLTSWTKEHWMPGWPNSRSTPWTQIMDFCAAELQVDLQNCFPINFVPWTWTQMQTWMH